MKAVMVLSVFFVATALASESVYVDREDCPKESCSYSELWFAEAEVDLLAEPKEGAVVVTTMTPGQAAVSRYGQVHTVPGTFVVRKDKGDFRVGDEVLVYTYLGEWTFKVSHNGIRKEVDLGISPYSEDGGVTCNEMHCWGALKERLEFTWWVNIVSESGLWGWVKGSDGFRVIEPSNPYP